VIERAPAFLLPVTAAGLAAALGLSGAAAARAAGEAPPAARPFADVPPGHWAYDAVEEMRRLGILRGYPPSPPKAAAPAGPAKKPSPAKKKAGGTRRR